MRQENKRIRYDDFRNQVTRVRELGAKTDADVAKAFNDSGYVPARGGNWTGENVARMRRRTASDGFDIEAKSARAASEPLPEVIAEPIFTTDGCLNEQGFRRASDAYAGMRGAEKLSAIERVVRKLNRPLPAGVQAGLKDTIELDDAVRFELEAQDAKQELDDVVRQ